MIDDKLGRAIDDINWADFTQRWEPPSLALDLGVFGGLHFIASAFTELQKVFEHCVSSLVNLLRCILTEAFGLRMCLTPFDVTNVWLQG